MSQDIITLLDISYLKLRYTMSSKQFTSFNNIEYTCKICHNLYDNSNISIESNKIHYTSLDIISHIG